MLDNLDMISANEDPTIGRQRAHRGRVPCALGGPAHQRLVARWGVDRPVHRAEDRRPDHACARSRCSAARTWPTTTASGGPRRSRQRRAQASRSTRSGGPRRSSTACSARRRPDERRAGRHERADGAAEAAVRLLARAALGGRAAPAERGPRQDRAAHAVPQRHRSRPRSCCQRGSAVALPASAAWSPTRSS